MDCEGHAKNRFKNCEERNKILNISVDILGKKVIVI